MVRFDKFVKGQRVVWSDSLRDIAKGMGHPDGPFLITGVTEGHRKSYRSMGHTQFIVVRELPYNRFSGAFFEREAPMRIPAHADEHDLAEGAIKPVEGK